MKRDAHDIDGRISRIEAWFAGRNDALVALSGGVDSTLLATLAVRALGPRAVAVTMTSVLQHDFEIQDAQQTARRIGIGHLVRPFRPLVVNEVRKNIPERCYFCKRAIFSIITDEARALGIDTVVDGTNADDRTDVRPGMRALAELGIESPLLELSVGKDEIRLLSRALGIPGFDRPPMACLASRFPHGDELTPEKIDRVRDAELFLRGLGFRVVRVRHVGRAARIEVGRDEVARLSSPALGRDVRARLLRSGFESVVIDPDGYRTGSMNAALGMSGRPVT
jgi:uncharacterized protein